VYDLQQQKFPDVLDAEKLKGGHQPPMNLSQVDYVLELGQLFNINSASKLYVHTDRQSNNSDLISRLHAVARKKSLSLANATGDMLPPASLHSFLKEARRLPGMFLSDYDLSYTNQYYHSIYDTGADNLGYSYDRGDGQEIVAHISRVAEVLAEFLFETSGSSEPKPSFQANRTMVNELLHCYLDSAQCSLFMAASNEKTPPFYSAAPKTPFSQYVGVDIKSQFHGILTRNVLAYLTGENLDSVAEHVTSAKDCVAPEAQNVYEHIFLKGEIVPPWWSGEKPCNESADCGYCYKTLSFRRAAISPAFVIENYDFSDR
jgi:nicastrin